MRVGGGKGEVDHIEFETPLGNRIQLVHGGVKTCDLSRGLFTEH